MDFNQLLQEAQRLGNETEIPSVERTISQVLQATQELHSRVTQNCTNDIQAQLLLGARGIDLPKLTQKVKSLSARQSCEPLNPIGDTEVDLYLKNVRNNAVLVIIEETNQNIFKTVKQNKMRSLFADWGDEKEILLNAMVGPNQEDFPDMPRHMVSTTLPQIAMPTSRLNRTEQIYAKEIKEYNELHGQGNNHFNLLRKLTDVVKDPKNRFDSQVIGFWNVLDHMTQGPLGSRNADPIKIRHTGQHFVQLAITYLEKSYKQYMITIISRNLVKGKRGGIPNVYNTVRSFVNINFDDLATRCNLVDMNNDIPLWPLVYYSLRCGDLAAASQFLKEAGVYPDLLTLIQYKQKEQEDQKDKQNQGNNLPGHDRPNARLERQLELEYSDKIRHCTDPFKKAVFASVLACDPHEPHPYVVRTIEDFLWMQLLVLNTEQRASHNIERLTYSSLQTLFLNKYGENYFNASEKKSLYFKVLILTGQFESAIEFLARTDENRVHAVHMGIALNELWILGTPSDIQHPLLSVRASDALPMRRLNLARLIIMYTKCFEKTDTVVAMHYYFLLRNFKGADERNLMLTCICDLVVENCDNSLITLIFGEPDKNNPWLYNGGMLTEFPSIDQEDKSAVANMAGEDLSRHTKYSWAIQLFVIAGELEKALRLLCSLLVQVVHQPKKKGCIRDQLADVIEKIDKSVARHKLDVDANLMATYMLLSQLLKFFDLYHGGNGREAAKILSKSHITPNSCDEVDECTRRLKLMGSDIIKVLPDVLLAAMDLIYTEYKEKKYLVNRNKPIIIRGAKVDGFRKSASLDNMEDLLMTFRERAKAITNMAATLPYRMPSDINNRLVQLEILMH